MKHKFALALQYKGATVQDNLKVGQKVKGGFDDMFCCQSKHDLELGRPQFPRSIETARL